MKVSVNLLVVVAVLCNSVAAYSPKPMPKVATKTTTTARSTTSFVDVQKAAMGAFAAATIAASSFSLPTPSTAMVELTTTVPQTQLFTTPSSSIMVSEKVIREGVYGEYEVDVTPQAYDDARSTFKPASETKSKKGKYTALLAILIVGSFIIPMAQYFWYVRDDDSSDQFFAGNVPEPEEPKKKKWF